MYEDYLAHYGILGMKWGVRRFQPYSVRGRKSGEGGREIGEARKKSRKAISIAGAGVGAAAAGYGVYQLGKRVDKEKLFEQSIKGGKDKPNVSPAEKIIGKTGEAINAGGKLYKIAKKKQSLKNGREAKKLSEEELKKRIARLELEKRYEDLSREDIARGKITTDEILDAVGSVAAIAGATATIYAVSKKVL